MIQLVSPTEKYLWKFLDLFKFIAFLKTREIFFSRLDQFEDEMELCSEHVAYDLISNLRIAELTPKEKNPNINPEEYEERGKNFIRGLHSLKDKQKYFCASCFYAADEESIAMWKLYAGIQGVAIKFHSGKLFKSLYDKYKKTLASKMEFGGAYMNYINFSKNSRYDEMGNIRKLNKSFSPYNKDISLKHENEYRFILLNNAIDIEIEPQRLKLDLEESYFDFIISPDTENWKIELINELISENGFNKTVKKSDIISQDLITQYKLKFLQDFLGNTKFPGRTITELFNRNQKK